MNEDNNQSNIHPFFNNTTRTRRISDQSQAESAKRARKITGTSHIMTHRLIGLNHNLDESQVYLPMMKKALYLLLCINSTAERLMKLERTSSGSHSNLASRRESDRYDSSLI